VCVGIVCVWGGGGGLTAAPPAPLPKRGVSTWGWGCWSKGRGERGVWTWHSSWTGGSKAAAEYCIPVQHGRVFAHMRGQQRSRVAVVHLPPATISGCATAPMRLARVDSSSRLPVATCNNWHLSRMSAPAPPCAYCWWSSQGWPGSIPQVTCLFSLTTVTNSDVLSSPNLLLIPPLP